MKRKEKPRARRGPVGAEMAAEPGRERSAVARQSPPPSLRRKRAAEPPVFEGPPWFPAKTAAGLAERAEGGLGPSALIETDQATYYERFMKNTLAAKAFRPMAARNHPKKKRSLVSMAGIQL